MERNALLFNAGDLVGEEIHSLPILEDAYYLYHGIPSNAPRSQNTVCFADFDPEWVQRVSDVLYFPTWSLKELLEANDLLRLGIKRGKLWNRFRLIGGLGGRCLSRFDENFGSSESQMRAAAARISNRTDIQIYLSLFEISPINRQSASEGLYSVKDFEKCKLLYGLLARPDNEFEKAAKKHENQIVLLNYGSYMNATNSLLFQILPRCMPGGAIPTAFAVGFASQAVTEIVNNSLREPSGYRQQPPKTRDFTLSPEIAKVFDDRVVIPIDRW
jgi:hypothetical protein